MIHTKKYITSTYQNIQIPVEIFRPELGTPTGVVQMVHGLTENCTLYRNMGEFFAKKGYTFIVHDVLGHGEALIDDTPMYLPKNGWKYAVNDIQAVYEQAAEPEEKILKRFLIGFSMGSFLVRCLLAENDIHVNGVVLAGTGNKSKIEICIGKMIAKNAIKEKGEKMLDEKINQLAVKSNDSSFKNDGYENAWLFKSRAAAQQYEKNDTCYKFVTPSFFMELLTGMEKTKDIGKLKKTNPEIFLISGEEDVVTKNIEKIKQFFEKNGCTNVEAKQIYGYRHAILSDECGREAWSDIVDWIRSREFRSTPEKISKIEIKIWK